MNKVAGLMTFNFITNRLQQRCFPVKFAEFSRTSILRTTAFKHRSSFLEVFCKSSCSASTNNVMKYSFSAAVVPKVVSVTYDLSKIELHHWYFSKNFITSAEQRYWKMHLDGCFWGRIYFGNIPEWLLLKGSCKRYNDFRNSYIYFKVGIHLYNS